MSSMSIWGFLGESEEDASSSSDSYDFWLRVPFNFLCSEEDLLDFFPIIPISSLDPNLLGLAPSNL